MRPLLSIALLGLLALGACRDNGVTDPVDAAAGTYSLVQLNGSELPVPAGQQAEVISGYLTLRRDSSYVVVTNTQVSGAAASIRIIPSLENGTFSADAGAISFRPTVGLPYTGTRNGRAISYTVPGREATYQRL
jgi:hypothetical protein